MEFLIYFVPALMANSRIKNIGCHFAMGEIFGSHLKVYNYFLILFESQSIKFQHSVTGNLQIKSY